MRGPALAGLVPALLLSVPFALGGCGTAAGNGELPDADREAQLSFFENLRELCGATFPGRVELLADTTSPIHGARHLAMHVETCEETQVRIPFHVDDDTGSRTWVLTLGAQGLLLKHDHRHADGTPEDLTNYGGWARPGGSPTRQSFPADDATTEMLPEAATNVWTLEIRPDAGQFVYFLERHQRPRFHAVFDMTVSK